MKTVPEQPQQALQRVGENLYRNPSSGIYYALLKRDRKQIRKSLKTADRATANRLLADLRKKVARLNSGEAKNLPFIEHGRDEKTGKPTDEIAGGLLKRWLDAVLPTVKPKSARCYLGSARQLARYFKNMTVRSITKREVEKWSASRSNQRKSRQSGNRAYNMDLAVLRRVMAYAMDHHMILENPCDGIADRPTEKIPVVIPTRDQFKKLIIEMRRVGGNDSADLCEMLAYSGCRLSEIVGDEHSGKPPLTWNDINTDLDVFTVTRSKNSEPRTPPLFPAMAALLKRFRQRLPNPPKPTDRIIPVNSAMTAINRACRKLGLPKYGHHTMRHLFCSNAIETGADFKTIASWLGHKDGGILVARTYGHLRSEHSARLAKAMTFSVDETPADNVVELKAVNQ
jgi:integrase